MSKKSSGNGEASSFADMETQYSPKLIKDVFQAETGHSIAPLSININCKNIQHWAQEYNHQLPLKTLSTEIKCWADLLNYRQINRLTLTEPQCLMDESGIETIIADLRHSLRFSKTQNFEFILEITQNDFDLGRITRYKALGFNHVLMHIGQDVSLDAYIEQAEQIRSNGIRYVSIVYPVKQPFRRSSAKVLEIFSRAKPEVLKLVSQCESEHDIAREVINSGLISTLLQFGYMQNSATSFIRTNSRFRLHTQDALYLGPSAISFFGRLEFINLSKPSSYIHTVRSGQLPISYFRQTKIPHPIARRLN